MLYGLLGAFFKLCMICLQSNYSLPYEGEGVAACRDGWGLNRCYSSFFPFVSVSRSEKKTKPTAHTAA